MSDKEKDSVFILIKSLSASDKRGFKLYTQRFGANENAKFVKLFDALDKMEVYDEKVLLKKAPVTKKQLANMKSHLYKQILVSLRLIYADHNVELQLNEQIDFARILYNKGLYKQSLKLLDKAKQTAKKYYLDTIMLRIVELEKVIESQHITRSMRDRAEILANEAKGLVSSASLKNTLSNLSLQLYGLYLKMGHVKDEYDRRLVEAYYLKNMPEYELDELNFYEKLYLFQAQVWFYHILQDFPLCYRAAQRWVSLYQNHPQMKKVATGNYLKAYHYLLDTLFYLQRYERFIVVFEQFKDSLENDDFRMDDNCRILAFLYYYSNSINYYFLIGDFSLGVEKAIPPLLKEMRELRSKLDVHHVVVLHYKIACLYFGSGDNLGAIRHLDEVISHTGDGLREDLQCFAHILKLIASYEEGLDDNLEQQIRNVYKFLIKMQDLHLVQQEMMHFVRKLNRIYEYELKSAFRELRDKLVQYENHPYEKRAFLYLDIISWLDSKIQNRPVQEVIREKFQKKIVREK
ncbi:hypothetical protein DN752_02515 [Echinicola strongylocentroti]|uniref:Uncharacterized protein n=1 Tax=Echinicola strongylocentroti TaxID=1795355 RepID=A0A2Z4IDI3_9BACT|nr:hypothetical protein [Echinicola strongylocentroti]AWW29101.1 hypothetical protein DN752_02515 [Echinicola strongylocentroti]